jgi:hypothetical protein
MNCLRVAREGGTIALAPEGNRTYSGKTEYMNPAIAALARKLALPIALYSVHIIVPPPAEDLHGLVGCIEGGEVKIGNGK